MTQESAAGVHTSANDGTFNIGGDLSVRRLGFGTMRLTGPGIWGEPKDRDEAIRVLRRAVELGVTFLDTADSYGPDVAEELTAQALRPYPADLVIATKGGFMRSGPDRWETNGRPEYLRAACEGSLRRLGVERIDLYYLHRIDTKVPADDQLGMLAELKAEGKIRHIGLSEVTLRQVQHARTVVPIVAVQNRYSVTDRDHERVLEYCERENLAFVPWGPLDQGPLAASGTLDRVASRLGITKAQVALAWLLWRSPVMLPIPGTSRVRHLEENVAARSVTLHYRELDELGALGDY